MNSLPDSVPYNVKVSFFEHQRKEWEKVLETSKTTAEENQSSQQHWASVNTYALAKIQEIDRTLEELKLSSATPLPPLAANLQPL